MNNDIRKEYERRAWRMVILCVISYTVVYIGKKTLSVCLSEMIAEGICTKIQGGAMGTCFLGFYAAGQLINGWIGEKIHPKNMICFGLLVAGICNVLMGVINYLPLFFIVWAVCGYVCSMLWAPIIRCVSTWTTKEISASSAALLSVPIPVGTILCYVITGVMLGIGGWRSAFIVCGAVCVIFAVALYLLFTGLNSHMTVKKAEKQTETESEATNAVTSGAGAIICFGMFMTAFAIIFNGMLKDGLDLWIPTILNDKYISSTSVVSFICTVLPIFNIFGVYFAKWLYSKYKMSELGTCAILFVVSAVSLTLVIALMKTEITSIIIAGIVVVLLAISSAAMLGVNTMLLSFIPLHYGKIGRAAFLTGLLDCFSYAAAAISGVITGTVSDMFGWDGAFAMFIIAAVIGIAVCVAGKKQLKTKTDELDMME